MAISKILNMKDCGGHFHKLQEQYLFLARHNIHSAEELVGTIASLTDKKKETSAEKSRIYKARERSRELFTAADEMENLKPGIKRIHPFDN